MQFGGFCVLWRGHIPREWLQWCAFLSCRPLASCMVMLTIGGDCVSVCTSLEPWKVIVVVVAWAFTIFPSFARGCLVTVAAEDPASGSSTSESVFRQADHQPHSR